MIKVFVKLMAARIIGGSATRIIPGGFKGVLLQALLKRILR